MKRLSVLFLGALAAVGLATSAAADATLDLVWSSSDSTDPAVVTGTSSILASSGDSLVLDVLLTAGTEGLSSYGMSVSFDLAELLTDPTKGDPTFIPPTPGGASEFGIAPDPFCTPFPACFFATPTLTPFTAGVSKIVETGPTTGFVFTFEAGTLSNGVVASFGQFKIGEIFFTVQTPADDGADLASGFFNTGADAAFDNGGSAVAMNFGLAAVSPLDVSGPEPGTSVLLALGLVGLAIAGRQVRS